MKKLFIAVLAITVLSIPITSFAKRKMKEIVYQKSWCADAFGKTEVRLPDGTRCDCITESYAIEFDFADNYYQAVGQALHYSYSTNKIAGIVLILESKRDNIYWVKLNKIVNNLKLMGIDFRLWKIENY
ncbi:MAG: hypothetical protein GY870_05745 [archaeon]|nr:hypothetical protein [archaeon]